MIQRKVTSVSLTPELHAFVRGLVATGSYGSSSEVVRAGLRLLQGQEAGAHGRSQASAASPQREEG